MLTDTFIRSASEGTYWDDSLKGFGVRIGKQSKTFLVLVASGRRQSIGRYPLISLADARKEARHILAEKQLGKVRPAHTAWDDAKAHYLKESAAKNRPMTVSEYTRQLATHFPFERKSLTDITPQAIQARLANLPPSEKHHAFTTVRAFLNWCVRNSLLDRSPIERLRTPANGQPRTRVLTNDELQALWQATAAHTSFDAVVRLLLLTGQRRGEIARLQWDWIDQENRTITIPASVTKNARPHTFPYGQTTAGLFGKATKMVDCPYLFPAARQSRDTTTVMNGWSKPKAALDRASGVTGYTLHDLRRTYSSTMAALGVPQIVVEKLLNHVSGGTLSPIAAVYNRHAYMNEMRTAVLQYEQHLTNLFTP